VEASGTTLTEIFGVGPILPAKIVGIVGDVSRFASKAHFASYAGVVPMEASSGEVVRHRLSLAGNRRLNQVMHMIAVCQARSDHMRGGAYHRKKLAEGKSRMEAIRCLKRGVSDAVVRYAGRRFGARFSRTRLTQRGLEGVFYEVHQEHARHWRQVRGDAVVPNMQ
jgi:transposase